MDERHYKIVNYSDKAVALLVEKDGAITEELTEIGGRFNFRLSCGPGWIFSRRKSYDALMHLMECYGIMHRVYELDELPKADADAGKPASRPASGSAPDYIITATSELVRYAEETGYHDAGKFPKYYPVVVRLADGSCVPIGAEAKLETEFWFADEGEDDAIEYARANREKYFIAENTERYSHCITAIKGSDGAYAWLANWNKDGVNRWSIDRSHICPDTVNAVECLDTKERRMYDAGLYRKLTDDDRERLIAGYTMMIEATERRCRTWLKRYGPAKLSIRTYYADR